MRVPPHTGRHGHDREADVTRVFTYRSIFQDLKPSPEIRLSDDSRAHVTRGDPDTSLPLEALIRGLNDHERHSDRMEVVVLVGAPGCSESVQQNKPCTKGNRSRCARSQGLTIRESL